MRISIDVMGGDYGSRPCVLAALKFLADYPSVSVNLVGDQIQIFQHLKNDTKYPSLKARLDVTHADEEVLMSDRPAVALRKKQASSMWLALNELSNGESDACVSGGNTGAMLAISMHLVGVFASIDRPAICKAIPTRKGKSFLLDLGANIDCSANRLATFALMATALKDIAPDAGSSCKPSVALLNIGSEATKGSDTLRDAAENIQRFSHIDFRGFIEGHELYDGNVDIVVCDGFAGNIALKSSEGAASFIFARLNEYFEATWFRKIQGLICLPLLKQWMSELNPSLFNGAMFLGLKKPVIKSHGGADQFGFYNALVTAFHHVDQNIPARVSLCLGDAVAK